MKTHHTLKFLAALIWYAGGILLLIKGSSLLMDAKSVKPVQAWPWLALILGIILGIIKSKYIFRKSCQNNLKRIANLHTPKLWQCYRPRFLIFLLLMIITGAALSRAAQNNYVMLIAVAALDLSIATALLASSSVFWQKPL